MPWGNSRGEARRRRRTPALADTPADRPARAVAENGSVEQLRVMTVCTGNICRSPMAEVVLRERLAEAGITDVVVDSTGTTGYELGEPMDPRARKVLLAAGYSDPGIGAHRARQVSAS